MNVLPSKELTSFLQGQFKRGGKRCSTELAEKISEMTARYPYYVQALSYHVFEVSGPVIGAKDIQYARKKLEDLDLIENFDGLWRVVDPVFACWLTGF